MKQYSLRGRLKEMYDSANGLGETFVLAFTIGVQVTFKLTSDINQNNTLTDQQKQELITQVLKDAMELGNEAAASMSSKTALMAMEPISMEVN